MKKFFIAVILCSIATYIFATHNRAGEITYRQISQYTYEFTLVTYTAYGPDIADRPEIDLYWGDNTFNTLPRLDNMTLLLPGNIKKNTYIGTHTFPGPGSYEIFMQDPNRNEGVENIPGSVEIMFAIKTLLKINPFIGYNNTPILLSPPVDKAAKGQVFVHNPAAYDPDGDSLSYKLTKCLGQDGNVIPNYQYPPASDTLYVDAVTGDLVWKTPIKAGVYNVALVIEEWRSGILIGSIFRDMQIEVYETTNKPPVFDPLNAVCITAGEKVSFFVSAVDKATEEVSLEARGGPFEQLISPASFAKVTQLGRATGEFIWMTHCAHVRKQPYSAIFKASDNGTTVDPYSGKIVPLSLVAYANADITVVGAAPKNLRAIPTIKSVALTWDKPDCNQIIRFDIYRKNQSFGFKPKQCELGVPAFTGFKKIGELKADKGNVYIDDNGGQGLIQSFNYCYHVVAVFPDGSESYASEEVCAVLVKGIPYFKKVSVSNTDKKNGEIELAWEKPVDIDVVNYPGPYKYVLYRSNNKNGTSPAFVTEIIGVDNLNFTDKNLNTVDSVYAYKIEFYNISAVPAVLIGSPQSASSHFLKAAPADKSIKLSFEKSVPWRDTAFVVYRQNPETLNFDSVGLSYTDTYTDTGLENEKEYWYKTKSAGKYPYATVKEVLNNYSQIISIKPYDITAPCTPTLQVVSDCQLGENVLTWNNPNLTCEDQASGYKIWYASELEGEMKLLTTINSATVTSFTHKPELSLAACYAISSFDNLGLESAKSAKFCIDNCTFYKLPNVFTPDNDGINDFFVPIENKYVEKVDFKIYSRWGNLVFQTDNPEIKWNGKFMDTDNDVAEGYYYYVCDAYERRLSGLEARYIVGFVHVFRSKVIIKE